MLLSLHSARQQSGVSIFVCSSVLSPRVCSGRGFSVCRYDKITDVPMETQIATRMPCLMLADVFPAVPRLCA